MKKITLIALMLFTALGYAQVVINTNNPDASSALEIESTTGGILIPRLTETQRDDITAPATGLMIYQTNATSGFYFYDGNIWTKIDGVAGPAGVDGVDGLPGADGTDGADGADGVRAGRSAARRRARAPRRRAPPRPGDGAAAHCLRAGLGGRAGRPGTPAAGPARSGPGAPRDRQRRARAARGGAR